MEALKESVNLRMVTRSCPVIYVQLGTHTRPDIAVELSAAVSDHGQWNSVHGNPGLDENRMVVALMSGNSATSNLMRGNPQDSGKGPTRSRFTSVKWREDTGISQSTRTVCWVILDTWQAVHSLHYWFMSWFILYHSRLLVIGNILHCFF